MDDKNTRQMVSPCGLNCNLCEVHREYDGKDPRNVPFVIAILRPFFKMGAKFSKKKEITLGMLDRMMKIPKEKPLCRGCRNEEGHCLIHSNPGSCKVYLCTKERGFHNCSECSDFPCENLYPSAILSDTAPHNTKVTNLCLIKKHGVDKWSKEYSEDIQNRYFHGEYPVDL